jgi:signal transduction histidine kinase
LLGALALAKPQRGPLTAVEQRLLSDVASQAGLVLKNAQLAVQLKGRLDELMQRAAELRESRQRLVVAQDAERRRIERDLHDGAQQGLIALGAKLQLVEALTDQDPAEGRKLMTEVRDETGRLLETLRELARGLYPPLLADRGLVAAIEAQGRRCSLPVSVNTSVTGRFPADIEAALYFCCAEALQNAAKHAPDASVNVTLACREGWLELAIADDGPGFAVETAPRGAGLQNMADRIAALDGELLVETAPGRGTVIIARVAARPVDKPGAAPAGRSMG